MRVYFRLEGPWDDPSGAYVPPGTLQTATGWAWRVITAGVQRIRNVIAPPTPPEPSPAEAPNSENGQGDETSAGQDPKP